MHSALIHRLGQQLEGSHSRLVVFDIETVTHADDLDGTGFPKPPHHVPVAIAHLHAEIGADGAQERYELARISQTHLG